MGYLFEISNKRLATCFYCLLATSEIIFENTNTTDTFLCRRSLFTKTNKTENSLFYGIDTNDNTLPSLTPKRLLHLLSHHLLAHS
jgi:hypothetical protein